MIKHLLMAIALFSSASAFADCGAQFRVASVGLIDKAMANGWTAIGETPLVDYKKKVAQSKVPIFCKNLSMRMPGRDTASYRNGNGVFDPQIIISKNLWDELKLEKQQTIALHETLGANKLQDNNYEFTTRIRIMSKEKQSPGSPLSAPLVNGKGGTVTGIGGGGDINELDLHELFYSKFRDSLEGQGLTKTEKFDLLRAYLETPIDFYFHNRIDEVADISCSDEKIGCKVGVGYNSLTYSSGVTKFLAALYVAAEDRLESK